MSWTETWPLTYARELAVDLRRIKADPELSTGARRAADLVPDPPKAQRRVALHRRGR